MLKSNKEIRDYFKRNKSVPCDCFNVPNDDNHYIFQKIENITINIPNIQMNCLSQHQTFKKIKNYFDNNDTILCDGFTATDYEIYNNDTKNIEKYLTYFSTCTNVINLTLRPTMQSCDVISPYKKTIKLPEKLLTLNIDYCISIPHLQFNDKLETIMITIKDINHLNKIIENFKNKLPFTLKKLIINIPKKEQLYNNELYTDAFNQELYTNKLQSILPYGCTLEIIKNEN